MWFCLKWIIVFLIQQSSYTSCHTGNSSLSQQANPGKSGPQTPIFKISQIVNIPVAHPVTFRVKNGFAKDTEPQWVHADALGISRIKIKEMDRVQIYLTDEYDDNSTVPLRNFGAFSGYLVVNHRLEPLPVGSTLDTQRGIFYWQPGPGFLGEYRFVFIENVQNRDVCRKNIMVKIGPRFE